MRVEILTIGDELCRGEIVDTNSSWLAARLWELGLSVEWMTSCRDDRDDMRRALAAASARAQLILISGGLGPTEDDLTVDVLAEVAGVGVTTDELSLERMKARYEKAHFSLTPNNLRQVRVPAAAEAFRNPVGAAPGFALALGSALAFAMPGVPREMQAIFEESIAPRLRTLAASSTKIAKRVYRVFGKGESHVDHVLRGLIDGVAGATIHFQVVFPETLVKLVVRDTDAAAAEARVAALEHELLARLGPLAYGAGEDSLAGVVGRELRAQGATLAVAESCTGGMLGALLTEVAGSSAYVIGGWIVYANEMKVRELGVTAETLSAFGAVSPECVAEMARGARTRSGATYAVAISGIAGPDGGTPTKPVGTVELALAGPAGVHHRSLIFPGARDQIRRLAAFWAMAMVLKELRGSHV